MSKRALTNMSRVGGYSFDKKQGLENSFAYGQSIEFRKIPSQVTLKEKTVKESGGTVVTEITDAVQAPLTGDLYLAGGTEIYKRTPETAGGSGTWSVFSTDANIVKCRSLLYKNDLDAILAVDDKYVHKIKTMSATPTLESKKYADMLDQSKATGGANTYTLPTVISEADAAKLTYIPTIEPLLTVKIYVVAKGTGDATLTMHDDANNSLGTVTITNANLTAGVLNSFTFTTPPRMLVKPNARTYHFHLTISTGTTTIRSTTASDLSTADYEFYAQRLISADYHPIAEFLQFVCIGNERYLSVWESLSDAPLKTEWEQHRLTFPSNYEVNGLAVYDEYLAISAYKKRSSDYGDDFGQDSTTGIIFFWDGVSTTYNFYVIIPEGAPESLTSYKNVLYYIANGRNYAWAGGQPVLIRAFPGIHNFVSSTHDADVYLKAPFNGIDVSDGVMHIGFPYKTVNETIKHGVYTWGSADKNYTDTFGYDHVPSHGRTGLVVANSGTPPAPISGITMIKSFGANLFIAWRDSADSGATTNYGVDIVKRSNDPYAVGSVENLIFDYSRPWKDKQAIEYLINFENLPVNCSVTPKYKIDRASNWTLGTTINTSNSTLASIHINKRFKEIQTGYDLVGSSSGSPTIIGDTLLFDDLDREGI